MANLNSFCHQLFNNKTSTGASSPVQIDSGIKSIVVSGTFVGTVVFQVSPDGGTTWFQFGGSITTPSVTTHIMTATLCRLNVSAFTSGSINAWICH